MIRVAVTYCLVLTTAAGPWLCCCASSRMAGTRELFRSFCGFADGESGGCCGHTHGPCRDLPPDRDAPPPSAPRECPCKVFAPSHAVLPPKPVEAGDTLSGDAQGLDHINVSHALPSLNLSSPLPRRGEWGRSPHPGGPRHILALLQTLRC